MIPIGTRVSVYIPDHMSPRTESVVIGHMHYDAAVCCVATETTTGMPVAEAHCTPIEGADDLSSALIWRERYLQRCGQHWFMPIAVEHA